MRSQSPGLGFDFYPGEHTDGLTNHVSGDGDGCNADDICRSFAESGVQRPGVVDDDIPRIAVDRPPTRYFLDLANPARADIIPPVGYA